MLPDVTRSRGGSWVVATSGFGCGGRLRDLLMCKATATECRASFIAWTTFEVPRGRCPGAVASVLLRRLSSSGAPDGRLLWLRRLDDVEGLSSPVVGDGPKHDRTIEGIFIFMAIIL